MNLFEQIQQKFTDFLHQKFGIEHFSGISSPFLSINTDEQKQQFGDLNSSIALALAKSLKKNPKEVAQGIIDKFSDPLISYGEVAGPGFLNFFLTNNAFQHITQEFAQQKEQFFKLDAFHPKKIISLEFVSANPTGPLHIGHGRGGIIGDVLGNILRFLGHEVIKEFYINDAGAQIAKLGTSFKIRCQQVAGHADAVLPEDAYHGDYLIDLAQRCIAQYGPSLVDKPDDFFATYAKEYCLEQIRHTLESYGIEFDNWFSEKILHESGAVEQAINTLRDHDYIYEKDGALWFASTQFGDDKDRVVQKASGELTYVAADCAYLNNKIARGAQELIMVLGQDHHSYAVRLQGALKALGLSDHPLYVILYQLVSIKQDGQLMRMSKRRGSMVTLDDIINTVGKDVARYFYLHRKADAHLDFDLELALKKTDENPVYYVQYAYVRAKSILQKAALIQSFVHHLGTLQTQELFFDADERLLVKKIVTLKQVLLDINNHHQTHQLAYYVHELAQFFNRYYHTHHVLNEANIEHSLHRLALTQHVHETLGTVFKLLGISCPEHM